MMKKSLLIFLAIFTGAISLHAQIKDGTYTNTWESPSDGALTYTLTLNPDKTFVFESHRIYEADIPPKTVKVSGKWKGNHRLLKLFTDASESDTALLKGLNKNKARYKAYSPRHRKYGTVKPSLKFYRSEVFYAKGMKLIKEETEDAETVVSGS